MSKNDGGQAFPGEYVKERVGGMPTSWTYIKGMSLREHYAGLALAGMCASIKYQPTSDPEQIARSAWKLADAMLAERDK